MTIPSLFTYSSSPVSKWSRSLSDVNRSTAANNPRPSASFSVRKNPQCTRVNTPPVFPGLRPCTWPHLLRLVTKTMLDRLLATDIVSAAVRCRQHTTRRTRQLPRARGEDGSDWITSVDRSSRARSAESLPPGGRRSRAPGAIPSHHAR